MTGHYRMDGTPYPEGDAGLFEWCRDFENTEKRRVGWDKLENGLEVSTVWLGFNHRMGTGRPLIFETMVFFPTKKEFTLGDRTIKVNREEFDMVRYCTLEEARLGHKMTVKRCRSLKSIDQLAVMK